MIKSENAPTLCPRCIHFTKGIDVGCRVGNYGLGETADRNVQAWLRSQDSESSWTYLGACPRFEDNGSEPRFMPDSDRRVFVKLFRQRG